MYIVQYIQVHTSTTLELYCTLYNTYKYIQVQLYNYSLIFMSDLSWSLQKPNLFQFKVQLFQELYLFIQTQTFKHFPTLFRISWELSWGEITEKTLNSFQFKDLTNPFHFISTHPFLKGVFAKKWKIVKVQELEKYLFHKTSRQCRPLKKRINKRIYFEKMVHIYI